MFIKPTRENMTTFVIFGGFLVFIGLLAPEPASIPPSLVSSSLSRNKKTKSGVHLRSFESREPVQRVRRSGLRPDASRTRDRAPDGVRAGGAGSARRAIPGHLPAPGAERDRAVAERRGFARRVRDGRRAGGELARELVEGFRRVQAQASASADEDEPGRVGARRVEGLRAAAAVPLERARLPPQDVGRFRFRVGSLG